MQEVVALVREVKSLNSLKEFKLVYEAKTGGHTHPISTPWPHGTIETILLGLSSLGHLENLEVSDQHSHVDLNG